jgi:hypothetical protein
VSRIIIVDDDGLDDETKAEMRLKFENGEGCRFCGGLHQRECPRIKHIIYNPSDAREVREVEFWPEWDRSTVLWPEDCV